MDHVGSVLQIRVAQFQLGTVVHVVVVAVRVRRIAVVDLLLAIIEPIPVRIGITWKCAVNVHLGSITHTIVIRVLHVRIGIPDVLFPVRQAVAIRVQPAVCGISRIQRRVKPLPPVPHGVVVRVRVRWIEPPVRVVRHLGFRPRAGTRTFRQPVVELLDVQVAVAVRVRQGSTTCHAIQLVAGCQIVIPIIQGIHGCGIGVPWRVRHKRVAAVVVGVVPLPPIPHAVRIRIPDNGIRPDPVFLVSWKPVAIGIAERVERSRGPDDPVVVHEACRVLGAHPPVPDGVRCQARDHVPGDIRHGGHLVAKHGVDRRLVGRGRNIRIRCTPTRSRSAEDVVRHRPPGIVHRKPSQHDFVRLRSVRAPQPEENRRAGVAHHPVHHQLFRTRAVVANHRHRCLERIGLHRLQGCP